MRLRQCGDTDRPPAAAPGVEPPAGLPHRVRDGIAAELIRDDHVQHPRRLEPRSHRIDARLRGGVRRLAARRSAHGPLEPLHGRCGVREERVRQTEPDDVRLQFLRLADEHAPGGHQRAVALPLRQPEHVVAARCAGAARARGPSSSRTIAACLSESDRGSSPPRRSRRRSFEPFADLAAGRAGGLLVNGDLHVSRAYPTARTSMRGRFVRPRSEE